MTAASTLSPPLQWQRMPLDGRVLIEASAGTGKTFNIGLIYLRLLLERGLGVEQILVTTFTEAAAQELRERLRRRLVEAERRLDATPTEPAPADSLEAWLDANFSSDRTTALRRIQIARIDFDRAPIATIHGLCRRIQRDYPLESGAAFAVDKLLDEKSLLRECVEDFWRRRYLGDAVDADEADSVLSGGPEGLLRDLGGLLEGNAIASQADGPARIQRHIGELCGAETIAELIRLGSDKKLYAPRRSALSKRLLAIANLLETGETAIARWEEQLEKYFDAAELDQQQSETALLRLRDHPLLRSLQTLRDLIGCRKNFARGAVYAAALAYCREELPRRARQRDVQTFSMLIDAVHARLCGAGAHAALAECLFKAFPAALIDEFQDTDQRQFEIFDRIYRDAEGRERGLLLAIGDPKQAIFGFRGGDIAAYLRASEHVAQRYSLAVNRRSSTPLVTALNALYANTDGGFDDARIRYRPVQAGGRPDQTPYAVAGMTITAPLSIHRFRGDAGANEPINAIGELEKMALEDCANRVAELLNDAGRTIGRQRVSPGDIAVLVSTNMQIVSLRGLLAARGVPCVGSGRASVFASDIARDLELILFGVLNAEDDRAVRGALSTRLLGARFDDFVHWQDDTQAFECELERFANWRALVCSRGVLALIEAVLAHGGARLLTMPDGERVITDLRHLGELLAEQETAQHGLDGLYAWFASMRRDEEGKEDDDDDAMQARQLRIESDARRVQLLTLHASKGLEFPIVFLPLVWRIRDRGGAHAPNVLRFHDESGNECLDLGSADFLANRAQHFREDLRERLRLLYVGLTRAQHAVHVYWVDRGQQPQDDDNNHIWQMPAIDLLIRQTQHHIGATPGEAGLDQLAAALQGIAVVEAHHGAMPSYQAEAASHSPRAAREPLPALRAFQWLHSFSGLIRQAQTVATESAASDEADADEHNVEPLQVEALRNEAEDARLLVLQPWRGPRFGEAVHKVLERAQPGRVWPEQRPLLAAQLAAQAVRARETASADPVELVGRMVDRVRDADLGDGLRLAALAADARVIEFEFQFPVQQVSLARLRTLCAQHGCAGAVPASLDATTLNGMLTGFADLIFLHAGRYHVLDYKTNRLGARLSDYAAPALDAAMSAHHYDLQALLYTVALHRYLTQRLDGYTSEQHLGESWYLFLRAVGLQAGLGVWRRQWPPALIHALDDAFAGVQGAAA
jgi:exodeoxyribonuclease V beta subunit